MSTTDLRPYPTLAPQPAPAAPMRRRPALPHGHVHWAAVVVATGALVVLGAGIARTFASSPDPSRRRRQGRSRAVQQGCSPPVRPDSNDVVPSRKRTRSSFLRRLHI